MRPQMRSPRLRDHGIALVIVLAFVVLLSGLVIAYFSRSITDRQLSNSSFNQSKVDELARSVLDILVSNLKQEIANGSSATTVGKTTLYTPTSGTSMVPTRNGVPVPVSGTYPIPNLLRVSAKSGTVGLVDYLASDAVSTGTSINGRYITPARWNQHYLIPRLNPDNQAIDSTPVATFTPPNWVFITNIGEPVALTSPSSSVIGRYAYAIYDEGALLDINVAGYPSLLPANAPHPAPNPKHLSQMGYAAKGALAFADLAQLPTSATTFLSQTQVDQIIGWRNYASAQASGTFPDLVVSATGAAAYYDAVVTNTNGFLKISSGTTATGRTDQAFLSRQQLISLQRSLGLSQNILQYLGTFSRSVTAPSWSPTANSVNMPNYQGGTGSSPVAYLNSADTAGSANRNLLNVRFSAPSLVTHYDDNGNSITYNVETGDPLLQRRFSLAKLAWLTYKGPSANLSSSDAQYNPGGTDANIQACFGLKWTTYKRFEGTTEVSNPCWTYVGPSGDTPQTEIETLDKIAAEKREPNFFEMLKAGMLNGSLGRDPGMVCGTGGYTASDWHNTEGATGPGFFDNDPTKLAVSTSKDKQIIQVGANIIDQSDADSYPTAIYFAIAPDPSVPEQGPINLCYGVENLPYLSDINNISLAYAPQKYGAWWDPVLWNPHQAPASTSTGPRPTLFRIVAYGQAWIYYSDGGSVSRNSPSLDFNSRADHATIYFSDTSGTNSFFYTKPKSLDTTTADITLTAPINVWQPGYNVLSSTTAYSNGGESDANVNKFVGFCAGTIPSAEAPMPIFDVVALGTWRNHRIIPSPLVTFCLQYSSDGGVTYLPYDYMSRIGVYTASTNDTISTTSSKVFYDRVDPRTDRLSATVGNGGFGSSHYSGAPHRSNLTFNYKQGASLQSMTYPRRSSGFNYLPANSAYSGEWAQNLISRVTNNSYYVDCDGVVRPGDGFRRNESISGDYGHGCVLYHADQPTATSLSVSARRPVILDRPFRSVGELGYVYRDEPFKSLDFWSASSGDAALLDLFSVNDEPAIVAGQINPNTASVPVLRAIIAGTLKNESTGLALSGTSDAKMIANQLSTLLTGSAASYIRNRAELTTAVSTAIDAILNGSNPIQDLRNKAYGESPVRALASVANTRTWNLMIDVIAQAGMFPSNAKTLDDFLVQGERRYWLHIAIDRFTGKIVDQQLEPVYE